MYNEFSKLDHCSLRSKISTLTQVPFRAAGILLKLTYRQVFVSITALLQSITFAVFCSPTLLLPSLMHVLYCGGDIRAGIPS